MTVDEMKTKLADKLAGLFDIVVQERAEHYKMNPSAHPTESDIESIVSHYANINMLIAAGSSLVPGPWGMLTAVPEIALIIKNQLKMIYDIGQAYGKGKIMNRDLLLSVFASGIGLGATSLAMMHGSKYIIKRASLRFFQKLVIMLAGRVSQQLIKSIVSKYLPVAGSIVMGAWARHSTQTIGKKAKQFLRSEIQMENVEVDSADSEPKIGSLELEKIKSMINLMRADRINHELEKKFLLPLIESSDLAQSQKESLKADLEKNNSYSVDFSLFESHPDDKIMHIIDLVALSKADQEFHPAERMYIKSVAKFFSLSEEEIQELF